MKFYSDTAANSGININGELIMFEDGVIETTDKNVIAALSGRYRSDEIAKTEQRDTARPKVEAEQEKTYAELREEAKAKGITVGRKNKAELIEALREGE